MTGETRPSASEILDRLEVWGQKLGLEATRRLLDALGRPQSRVPTVLVAGTNGKGSTSAALASILSAVGFRCGLYTSPHLERVEERLRIDGEAIGEAELGHRLRQVLDAAGATPPTYFESLTAAAWLHFAHHGVDAAVFEVGLGGRLDATNVSDPLLSVITRIARDHAPQLGFTLTSIAGEKAGVMRPGRICLTSAARPEVERELRRCAAVCGARLLDASDDVRFEPADAPAHGGHELAAAARRHRPADRPGQPAAVAEPVTTSAGSTTRSTEQPARQPVKQAMNQPMKLETARAVYRFALPLAGGHQLQNLALAVRAAEEFCALMGRELCPRSVNTGVESLCWPGRLEWVEVETRAGRRRVLFDAAHNPAGAAALDSYLEETGLCFDLLYGSLAEKHPERCLPMLAARADRLTLTAFNHPRAASPGTLATLIPAGRAAAIVVAEDAADALEGCLAAPSQETRALVVTGSLYLVGEVRAALHARYGAPLPARELVTGFRP